MHCSAGHCRCRAVGLLFSNLQTNCNTRLCRHRHAELLCGIWPKWSVQRELHVAATSGRLHCANIGPSRQHHVGFCPARQQDLPINQLCGRRRIRVCQLHFVWKYKQYASQPVVQQANAAARHCRCVQTHVKARLASQWCMGVLSQCVPDKRLCWRQHSYRPKQQLLLRAVHQDQRQPSHKNLQPKF